SLRMASGALFLPAPVLPDRVVDATANTCPGSASGRAPLQPSTGDDRSRGAAAPSTSPQRTAAWRECSAPVSSPMPLTGRAARSLRGWACGVKLSAARKGLGAGCGVVGGSACANFSRASIVLVILGLLHPFPVSVFFTPGVYRTGLPPAIHRK